MVSPHQVQAPPRTLLISLLPQLPAMLARRQQPEKTGAGRGSGSQSWDPLVTFKESLLTITITLGPTFSSYIQGYGDLDVKFGWGGAQTYLLNSKSIRYPHPLWAGQPLIIRALNQLRNMF